MSHLRWICVIFLCCTSWYLNCSESRQGSEGFIWSQFELFNKKSQMKPQKGTLDRGFDWKPSDYPQDISPLRSFFQLSWLHLFSRRLLLCGQDTNSKYYIRSIGAIRPPEEFNYLFFSSPLGIKKVVWQLNCKKGCANTGSCQMAVIFAIRQHSSDKHWWNI